MKLLDLAKEMTKEAIDRIDDINPSLLTGVSIGSTILACVFVGRATVKSVRQYDAELERRNKTIKKKKDKLEKLPVKDTVKLCWKNYIPAAVCLSTSITGNALSTKNANKKAALATSAANLANQALSDYKESVNEIVTDEETKKKIRERVDEKKTERENVVTGNWKPMIYGTGPTLFKLDYNGTYFRSSVNRIDKVVNNLNHDMMFGNEMECSLSDFFYELGIRELINPSTDKVGWTIDNKIETRKDRTGICECTDEPYILVEFLKDPTN